MTLLKPTIQVSELKVLKDKRDVFSCRFHSGVNIIRGHNSSGKTTILDFLAYALGAENVPWKQEALLCDEVMLEVKLNETAVTLRRPINKKIMNPLQIFWGGFSEATAAPVLAWETYPFKRSSAKISFTQAILLALGLPEAQGDGASNLTMHQFLRVLYADQPSLHSPIFRTDTFDSPLVRETVGNYLCGVYDDRLYASQLQRRDLAKEEERVAAELRSIYTVIAKSEQDFSLDFFDEKLKSLAQERDNLVQQLSALRSDQNKFDSQQGDTEEVEKIRNKLDLVKRNLLEEQDRLHRIELEQLDSKRFVEELKYRVHSIEDANIVRNYFGSVKFSFCPACLTEVKHESSETCSLCKSHVGSGVTDGQVLRMKNELRIQLQESETLMVERDKEINSLRAQIPLIMHELRLLEERYATLSKKWMTKGEVKLESLAMNLGAIDQEIKGLIESQRLGQVIKDLQEKRSDLVGRLAQLDSIIESLELTQAQKQRAVAFEISETLGRLLRKDLYRQEEFRRAKHITFSFSENSVTVDGASKFSESSTVVLRHLFHLAMLSVSVRVPEMRLPRFMVLDGIEDGGMELSRAHLLQEIIVEECESFEADFQLIIATSQISPSLDIEGFVVGRNFTEDSRSLEILN